MADPVLTPELALNCNSDVPADLWVAIAWDQANSDVADWLDRILWSKVSGTLTVRTLPAQREVLVLGIEEVAIPELNNAIGRHIWANGRSSADGSFLLQWSGYQGDVITLYLDDFGTQWQPNTTCAEGDIVYPSVWNGWQYECIAVGTTDSIEPIWWHDEGSTSFSGTAAFKARQYLPALADGPITPYQWTEQ
jgi:hypothetical protein